MPARLILNADDFGLTPGINRAVAELHAAGVLTSATLMANGPAFDDAVAVAHQHPTLGVGAHIVLLDGRPLAEPATISTLLDPETRRLRPTLTAFVQALLTRRISEDDIAREALTQVQTLQRAGIHPTHLDTHKHAHLFPQVLRPLLRVARETGIAALRLPFEPAWAAALAHGTPSRRAATGLTRLLQPRFRALLGRSRLRTPDATLGIAATGHLTAPTLAAILDAVASAGRETDHLTFELCCHPGYHTPDLDRIPTRLRAHRNTEREALLTVLPQLLARPNAPRLIHYGDL